jgi:hypothetical protein
MPESVSFFLYRGADFGGRHAAVVARIVLRPGRYGAGL